MYLDGWVFLWAGYFVVFAVKPNDLRLFVETVSLHEMKCENLNAWQLWHANSNVRTYIESFAKGALNILRGNLCIYNHLHVHIHTQASTYTESFKKQVCMVQKQLWKIEFLHTWTHTCVHTHMQMYVHTHICTYTHYWLVLFPMFAVVFRGLRIMENLHAADQQLHVADQQPYIRNIHMTWVCMYIPQKPLAIDMYIHKSALYIHACIHTYIHTYVHTYICIHTYVYIYISEFGCLTHILTRID